MAKLGNKNLESALYGPEPSWDKKPKTPDEEISAYLIALRWYHYMASESDQKTWCIEYLKKKGISKEVISKINRLPRVNIKYGEIQDIPGFDTGVICRLLTLGAPVPAEKVKKLEQMLKFIEEKANKLEPEVVDTEEEIAEEKVSIQDKIKNKISDVIGELEHWCDVKLTTKQTKPTLLTVASMSKTMKKLSGKVPVTTSKEVAPTKTVKDFFHAKNIKAGQCPQIAAWFEEKKKGVMEDMKHCPEAYHCYEKQNLMAFASFVDEVITTCNDYAKQVKSIIKIRKKKAKPAGVIVKNMKYQLEYPKLKIKSISPTKIIGAEKVLLFNTKYNKATLLECTNSNGLTVKGTTIINFDANKSFTKKIRKPEKFIKDIEAKGIRVVKTAFDGLKSKQYEAKGRVGEDTIILGVY